jgi:hypothetical protein
MGEVVPRCGAGSLVKIVVRESLKNQVRVSWHVESGSSCESSLCPSACFCEDPLQVKRVTSCCCLIRLKRIYNF